MQAASVEVCPCRTGKNFRKYALLWLCIVNLLGHWLLRICVSDAGLHQKVWALSPASFLLFILTLTTLLFLADSDRHFNPNLSSPLQSRASVGLVVCLRLPLHQFSSFSKQTRLEAQEAETLKSSLYGGFVAICTSAMTFEKFYQAQSLQLATQSACVNKLLS